MYPSVYPKPPANAASMFAMSESITHPTITILCTLLGNVPMAGFRANRTKRYCCEQIHAPIEELMMGWCPIFRREADTGGFTFSGLL
jgi:hypothetical protein